MLDVELARERTAPRAARALMEEQFAGTLSDSELETARLLVSELVTNAVVHGLGRLTLRARLHEDRLLVEVLDEGSGLEQAVRSRDFERPGAGGLGLAIVDAESSRWGIDQRATHVWFELERQGPHMTGGADRGWMNPYRVAPRPGS